MSFFPTHTASDAIVLYTNSVRCELNDLIFLTSFLQGWHTRSMHVRRMRQRNIQVDFEIWFSRFSQFLQCVLRAVEDYAFPMVSDLLDRRDVMVSRSTAVFEAEGMSYVQLWSCATMQLFKRMEHVRDQLSHVDNRLLHLNRCQFVGRGRPSTDVMEAMMNAMVDTVRQLIPACVQLLNELDNRITPLLSLGEDNRKSLRAMHRQMVHLLSKECTLAPGWAVIGTLTRWIDGKKARNEKAGQLSRAAKLSLFSKYRADNWHHTIVKMYRGAANEERKRSLLLQRM